MHACIIFSYDPARVVTRIFSFRNSRDFHEKLVSFYSKKSSLFREFRISRNIPFSMRNEFRISRNRPFHIRNEFRISRNGPFCSRNEFRAGKTCLISKKKHFCETRFFVIVSNLIVGTVQYCTLYLYTCILYTVYCIPVYLYTCILYTVYCIVYTFIPVYCTLYTV